MATISRGAARPYQVLDPRTMGRPVHRLGRFTDQLRKDLTDYLQARLNRRYRSRFEVGDVAFEVATLDADAPRWFTFSGNSGRINFALERQLLLCILGYRYGTHSDAPATAEPETATEERLAARLGRQLASVVAARIELLQPTPAAPDAPPASSDLAEMPSTQLKGAWTLRVRLTEQARGIDGNLWFQIEEGWIARLLRGLAPSRDRARPQIKGLAAQPLPPRLQLTLTARLLEKQLPLGTLLDMRVGDVIPITLGDTDVLIGDSRLFTASVAEHKGKLCLTSFEDLE